MKLSEYLKKISENLISISNFKDIEVEVITNDSRKAVSNSLFVAIKGANLDGHDYIENAILSGAGVVVYQNKPSVLLENVVYIEIDNAYLVYALLAEVFFKFPAENMKIIGITGTNGKTTSAFLIDYILNHAGLKTGLISTVQYSYGDKIMPALRTTPEAFELQKLFSEMNSSGSEHVVMEVSSHSLSQYRLGSTKLTAALFTNLSGDHLDYHGNMENYYLAKKRLFDVPLSDPDAEMPKIINIDDSYGARLKSELTCESVVSYGSSKRADFKFLCDDNGSINGLIIRDKEYLIESSLIGRFNAYNISGAAALCIELGIPVDIVIEALKSFPSVPGRLEEVETSNDVRCYVDYAHTDDALKRALIALKELNPSRLVLVFGCGGDRDKTKRSRMGMVAFELADVVIVTSDNPRTENPMDIINDIISGINYNKEYKIISDRKEAIFYAVDMAERGDIVLIAGKGHENYQEIGTKRYPFDDRVVVRTIKS